MFARHRHALWVAALLSVTVATPGRADMASAEALFQEGRTLFDAGEIAKACEKFSESQRLDPSAGTLLNLARCHKEQGKTASAWAEYLAAKRAAETQGRADMAAEAERQAQALQPTLSTMTLTAESPPPDLVVRRNDEVVEAGALNSELPIDPGRYTLEAAADGYQTWQKEVVVEGGADRVTVHIPALTPLPEKAVAPADGSATETPIDTGPADEGAPADAGAPIAAYVVGGAGIVVTGVGLTFGALAKSAYDNAESECPSFGNCSEKAMNLRADAETRANVANVAVPVGLAAVGVGVVMLLLHDSPSDAGTETVALLPLLAPRVGGAQVFGTF